jgi:hypothetical protein
VSSVAGGTAGSWVVGSSWACSSGRPWDGDGDEGVGHKGFQIPVTNRAKHVPGDQWATVEPPSRQLVAAINSVRSSWLPSGSGAS